MAGVLVTGGAGYIGSHVTRLLAERGESVVVVDNLSTGFKEAVLGVCLIEGNVGDQDLIAQVIKDHGAAFRRPHRGARIGGKATEILWQQHRQHPRTLRSL